MRYNIAIHEFSFNKIKSGSRKIGIHLLDKKAQNIKLFDVLNLRNSSTGEQLERIIKGIAIFDNFNDLVDSLGAKPLGYNNKEEIMVRLNRIYPKTLRQTLNVVAFFLDTVPEQKSGIVRGEIERS